MQKSIGLAYSIQPQSLIAVDSVLFLSRMPTQCIQWVAMPNRKGPNWFFIRNRSHNTRIGIVRWKRNFLKRSEILIIRMYDVGYWRYTYHTSRWAIIWGTLPSCSGKSCIEVRVQNQIQFPVTFSLAIRRSFFENAGTIVHSTKSSHSEAKRPQSFNFLATSVRGST